MTDHVWVVTIWGMGDRRIVGFCAHEEDAAAFCNLMNDGREAWLSSYEYNRVDVIENDV